MSSGYHEHPAIGSTDVKYLAQGYRHYLNSKLPDFHRSTTALNFGTAVHTAILEPHKLKETVSIIPECDRRTKAGKALYNQHLVDNPDMIRITLDEWNMIRAMTNAVRGLNYELLRESLEMGEAEVERYGEYTIDEMTDTIQIKGRADLLTADIIWDLKTTTAIDDVNSTIMRHRYDLQAYHYMQLFERERAIFIFVEKSHYPRVKLVQMYRYDMEQTHTEWIHALRNYTEHRNPVDITTWRWPT